VPADGHRYRREELRGLVARRSCAVDSRLSVWWHLGDAPFDLAKELGQRNGHVIFIPLPPFLCQSSSLPGALLMLVGAASRKPAPMSPKARQTMRGREHSINARTSRAMRAGSCYRTVTCVGSEEKTEPSHEPEIAMAR
jgi:hypothetical protein